MKHNILLNPLAKRESIESVPFSFNNIHIDRSVAGFNIEIREKIAVIYGPDKKGGFDFQGDERIKLHTFINPDTNNLNVLVMFSYTNGCTFGFSVFNMLTQDEKDLIQEMVNYGLQNAENVLRLADFSLKNQQPIGA